VSFVKKKSRRFQSLALARSTHGDVVWAHFAA